VLDDVAAIRALAHPTRLDILDLLRENTTLTATECANLLGLTPKTCSYHLQILAKHGFVTEAPAPGKRRPWKRTHETTTLRPPGANERGLRAARDEVLQIRIERDRTLLRDVMTAITTSSQEWSQAVTVHGRTLTLTAAELAAWGEEVEEITQRWSRLASQSSDESDRRPVHLMFYGFPRTGS